MKKILLCPNLERDTGLSLTLKVYKQLKESGLKPVVCSLFEKKDGAVLPGFGAACCLSEEVSNADMIITFGGDGTLLHAARAAAQYKVPVLGINLGTKGFMADLEPADLDLVFKAVSGHFMVDKRMMLDVSIERRGEILLHDFALNDVVVGGIARLINISVFGDGEKISEFSGDGIVVATPTGSTAYSMSAGGPIVEPAAENIIVTPICAHVLIAKSFVLAPQRVVTLQIGKLHDKAAYISVDGGGSFDLQTGDIIKISRSKLETALVHVSKTSFYDKVSEKLGERK